MIQFATDSVDDDRPLQDVFNGSAFLREFREMAAEHTRGCVVLERPDLLVDLAERYDARDTTVRKAAVAELQALQPRASQYSPGDEIPERNWVYWLLKKYCFNDFGTYGRHFKSERWQAPRAAGTEASLDGLVNKGSDS